MEAGFKSSAGMFREMKRPYDVAVIQLEHHEWLVATGRGEEPVAKDLASEARQLIAARKERPRADVDSIARFDEAGRWVEDWNSWDQLGMMQQLGVIPTPGTA